MAGPADFATASEPLQDLSWKDGAHLFRPAGQGVPKPGSNRFSTDIRRRVADGDDTDRPLDWDGDTHR